ncbi:hypothetical protein LCGC14_0995990 [marine sediment metagenome]|uniref:Uncharacterized protein n=1 Tax=marine sediment metagenome TaxID=412755 RepID=A0A0F9NQW2_9ZZZZ
MAKCTECGGCVDRQTPIEDRNSLTILVFYCDFCLKSVYYDPVARRWISPADVEARVLHGE